MLERYIRPDRIVLDLNIDNKWRILEALTRIFCRNMPQETRDNILYSVLWRDMKFSTGLGGNIAIPHGRTDTVNETGILFARFKKGIDWGAIDNKKVYYVFLIIGPVNATDEYLDILSKISKLLSRKMMRKALLETDSIESIGNLIGGAEERRTKRFL